MNEATTKKAIQAKAKSILRKYRKLEDENYHSENLLLLAETCGTEEEVKHCKKRVETMTWEYQGRRYELPGGMAMKINAYYYDLVNLAK